GLAIELRNRAVGASAGTLDLIVGAGSWLGASTMRQIPDGLAMSVPVDDIGAVMAEFAPNVVVIDVEGMEAEILPRLRFDRLPAIVVEFHNDVLGTEKVNALRRLIKARGFGLQTAISAEATEAWVREQSSNQPSSDMG